MVAGRGASRQAFPRRAWEREKKSDFFESDTGLKIRFFEKIGFFLRATPA
jgi:hypothetical protein